ncbi:MAG TPA: M20/M25/M40 family metallo-hydrolase [Sphingomicrobium sp.]|nr:M20/M25/M40 family metallo-hydrolase [Sphingomicrobium sp.]
MRLLLAASLLAASSPALAQARPDSGRRAEERALFEKIIEIPTVEGRTAEFKRLTALLTGEFRKAGITNVIVKDHDGTQTLIARWPATRPSGKKPVMLLAHMDVVEAKASDWQNPPFEFREKDGHYLGRGANDNKSQLTGIVLALQELKRQNFQPTRDIVVLFTGDEETKMSSIRRASTEWRSLIDSEYALNFDAGGGSVYRDGRVDAWYLQIAEKTYADYKMIATNRGGHSSAPRPDNAIGALAGAITAIERHRFEPMINDATRAQYERIAANDKGSYGELIKQFLANPKDREYADLLEANDLGGTRTRCVTTMLSGGHAPNALPQRAEANVNCRIFPGVKIESVRLQLQQLAGPDVTVTTLEAMSTPETDPSPLRDDITQAYRAAVGTRFPNAPIVPFQSAGASDGSYLRSVGIPVYGVGGSWGILGEKYGAHGLDEKELIEGFHGQVPITVDLIKRLAG